MFEMLKLNLCIIFSLYIFLCRDVSGQCSGDFPVKANLKYNTVGDYFSFTSTTPDVNDMLKGSGETFKGPAGDDVTVTIRGMSYFRYLICVNDMVNYC